MREPRQANSVRQAPASSRLHSDRATGPIPRRLPRRLWLQQAAGPGVRRGPARRAPAPGPPRISLLATAPGAPRGLRSKAELPRVDEFSGLFLHRRQGPSQPCRAQASPLGARPPGLGPDHRTLLPALTTSQHHPPISCSPARRAPCPSGSYPGQGSDGGETRALLGVILGRAVMEGGLRPCSVGGCPSCPLLPPPELPGVQSPPTGRGACPPLFSSSLHACVCMAGAGVPGPRLGGAGRGQLPPIPPSSGSSKARVRSEYCTRPPPVPTCPPLPYHLLPHDAQYGEQCRAQRRGPI